MSVVEYEDFSLADGIYPQPDGILAITSDAQGRQWAHWNAEQPTLLDPIGAACIALVLSGELSMGWKPGRGFTFISTDAGRERVETAIRRGGFDKGLDA